MKRNQRNINIFLRKEKKLQRRKFRKSKKAESKNNNKKNKIFERREAITTYRVRNDFSFFKLSIKGIRTLIKRINRISRRKSSIDLTEAKSIDIAAVTYASACLGKNRIKAKYGSRSAKYLQKIMSGRLQEKNFVPVTEIVIDNLKKYDSMIDQRILDLVISYGAEDSEAREKFSIAIAEAYANVSEHSRAERAYVASFQSEEFKFFVVCDTGIGIPETIRIKVGESKWHKFLSAMPMTETYAERCLKAAIDGTSTEFAYRGKGLGDIINSINDSAHEGSSLVIASGQALLKYTQNGDIKTWHLKEPLQGTLLHWII